MGIGSRLPSRYWFAYNFLQEAGIQRGKPNGRDPAFISGIILGCLILFASPVRGEGAKRSSGADAAVSIMAYGASPDGGADDTAAITAAIKAARFRQVAVLVPVGTFAHRSFSLNGVVMVGAGPASVLLAREPTDATIYLRGSGSILRNLTVQVTSSHRDAHNPAVYIDHARRFIIDQVTVKGGNSGGIFNFGGSFGEIVHNRVQDTLADAIHNTHGAHDMVISGNTVRRAGDDMIAVVSYGNEVISHNILIQENDLADQESGRGIAVVGGTDVTIQRNTVAQTRCCAGIYLASESAMHTRGTRNVLVRSNILTSNGGPTGHGAIMVYADYARVRDVCVEHNTIISAHDGAITVEGLVDQIALVDNHIVNPSNGGITGDTGKAYCAGNTLDGLAQSSSVCGSSSMPEVTGWTNP